MKSLSDEKIGIISQMNRTASSIPANIADGSSRGTGKDQARFIRIVLGSASELETFCLETIELGLLDNRVAESLLEMIKEE